MSNEEKAYAAGFLDGDGCIMAQLVRRKDYIFGYQVRTSVVFYQKKKNQEILSWLQRQLRHGYIRERNDGMVEYTIVGFKEVKEVLSLLYPFLRLKRILAKKVLKLIDAHPHRMTKKGLLKIGKLVDETAKYTYSKKRTNTSATVREFFARQLISP